MQAKEMASWKQKRLLGVSLKVVAPTGQYDPTKLVNWGGNRWAFKPEIGYSERWGHWVFDAYAAVWFYTRNPASYDGPVVAPQTEAPIAALESHLSYDFKQRMWMSLAIRFCRTYSFSVLLVSVLTWLLTVTAPAAVVT